MNTSYEDKLINNLKLSLADFKNQKNITGDHWNYYFRDTKKFFDVQNLINFRNKNLLSNGLDDSLLITKFENKDEIIENILNYIGQDFFHKNLNKKNIGNCESFVSYKDMKIDFNDLLKMHWCKDLQENVFYRSKIDNICEIGGGYGNFARIILNNYKCKYFLIDLPHANLISSYYLKNNFPDKKIYLYSDYQKEINNIISNENYNKHDIFILTPWCNLPKKISVDLFINAKSMMEMNFNMIVKYFSLIQSKISAEGFFLNINRYEKDSVGYPVRIHEYPYDKNWEVILSKQSIIQNKIHFLITKRNFENTKNGINAELNKIKIIAKKFYRRRSLFDKFKKYLKKLLSKHSNTF